MTVRWMTVAAAVLLLLAGACQRELEPGDNLVHLRPTADDSEKAAAAAQNRIAGAFYASLVPKLRGCWGQVKGKGEIQFRYSYRRQGTDWVWRGQELNGSSLEKPQEAVALQCMRDAASGSRFPAAPEEVARGSSELVIHWGWPVPLPEDITELARMIVDRGPAECQKLCKDCAYDPVTRRSSCAAACSGFTGCVEDGTGAGCRRAARNAGAAGAGRGWEAR